jgi:hypothetical protein
MELLPYDTTGSLFQGFWAERPRFDRLVEAGGILPRSFRDLVLRDIASALPNVTIARPRPQRLPFQSPRRPPRLPFRSLPPEVLEPIWRERRVDRGAGDRPMVRQSAEGSVAIRLRNQLRQPCDVDSDAPRLILREHLGLQSFRRIVARVQIGERLAAGVADDVAARNGFGSPWWREAALVCHDCAKAIWGVRVCDERSAQVSP